MHNRKKEEVLSSPQGNNSTRLSARWIRTHFGRVLVSLVISAFALFWFAGVGASVAWAQIPQKPAKYKTLKGVRITEITENGEEPRLYVQRTYWKKPGIFRTEFLRVDVGADFDRFCDKADIPIEQIVVTMREGDRILETRLQHRSETVTHTYHIVVDEDDDASSDSSLDRVPGLSEKLKNLLQSDATKQIGERTINGSKALGYELSSKNDLDEIPGNLKLVRLWIDNETRIPVEIMMEGDEGFLVRSRWADIVCDADLPDSLFKPEEPEGWIVYDLTQQIENFIHKSLKPDVFLLVQPVDGMPLLTEDDVVFVDYVSKGYDGSGNPRWSICMKLKPRVADRLESYASKHSHDKLSVDFNGEMEIQLLIYEAVIGRSLTMSMVPLGLSPREFEEKYLCTTRALRDGTDPTSEKITEIVYRIEFTSDDLGSSENDPARQEKLDRLVEWLRLGLDEPGIEEITWQDQNLLVIKIGDEITTGIDASWTRKAVEELLNTDVPTFEMAIIVKGDGDEFDLDAKTKELVAFLKRKEVADGGWPLDIDLGALTFDTTCRGRKVQCKWSAMSPENFQRWGIHNQKIYTLDAFRSDYRTTEEQVATAYFQLVQIYNDREWRFTATDIASVKASVDCWGQPSVGFELRSDRQEDFGLFTKSHIRKRLAIVVDGMIYSDPVIQSELPGSGIISGPQPHGFSKEQQMKMLSLMISVLGSHKSFEYEFVECR